MPCNIIAGLSSILTVVNLDSYLPESFSPINTLTAAADAVLLLAAPSSATAALKIWGRSFSIRHYDGNEYLSDQCQLDQ